MTNPNNAVGTNAAYGGRTSVDAFNDGLAAYSRGVLSGWACSPDSGLTVVLGGDGNTRDVAIAEDDAGNKTTINNISGSPISVTIGAAPGANTRVDSIVAYVDGSPQGTSTDVDNYGACGLIVVQGTASSSPVPPADGTIRSAITADGASGATAYYVVLANVTVANGTTDITSGEIDTGDVAKLKNDNLPQITISAGDIDFDSFGVTDLNFGHYIRTTIGIGFSVPVYLCRIGNLVIVQGSPIISGALPSSETVVDEKIPLGYRPISASSINIICGSETNKSATWWVSTNGTMSMIASGFTTSANRRLNISSAWVTQDDWPSA